MDGRKLHFHIGGLNNENVLLQDEETGSWWQQATGEAILGPMAGRGLQAVDFDEVTFKTWRKEHPEGLVLRPAPSQGGRPKVAAKNWERSAEAMPVVTPRVAGDPLPPHSLVLGVERGGTFKAYPFDRLKERGWIVDTVGGIPILLLLGEQRRTVRAFETRIEGRTLSLTVKPGPPLQIVDQGTGDAWDFAGNAVTLPSLPRVQVLKVYWFEWEAEHRTTEVFLE